MKLRESPCSIGHLSTVLVAAIMLVGCTGKTTTSTADATLPQDDLGFVMDAVQEDSASPAEDSAPQPSPDSGVILEDSAVIPADSGDPPPVDSGLPWWNNGVATCPELTPFVNNPTDCSATLQLCIDRTPAGAPLELPAGQLFLAAQVSVSQALTLRTQGQGPGQPPCPISNHGCAELTALPALNEVFGMLQVVAADVTVDHIVLNGDRQNRAGSAAYNTCVGGNNANGFNGAFSCSNCTFSNSVSKNALCGTGLLVAGPASAVTVSDSAFAYNGVHNQQNLWSDGLTVHDASNSSFVGNTFIDNSDIDLIFGGCQHCVIQNNTITHTADPAGGAFAALMIQKWPSTSGNYDGVDVSNNSVDCGPLRNCGSGLYIGSESWYPETPFGTLQPGTTSGTIHHNSVVNAMNGLYIAAIGLTIYQNGVLNAHGVQIPNSCHKPLVSATPYVVSPTAQYIHFMGENVDPAMSVHFSSADWSGCIPNYPF